MNFGLAGILNLNKLDPASFESMTKQYWRPLLRLAWHLLNNQSEAEEVVQDAFLKLWQARDKVTKDTVYAWLRVVVRNQAFDLLRKRKYYASNSLGEDLEEENEGNWQDQIADDLPNPEHSYAGKELGIKLEEAFSNLPDRQRVVLVLTYFENLTPMQIAMQLEITIDAVDSLLRRGKIALRQTMGNSLTEAHIIKETLKEKIHAKAG